MDAVGNILALIIGIVGLIVFLVVMQNIVSINGDDINIGDAMIMAVSKPIIELRGRLGNWIATSALVSIESASRLTGTAQATMKLFNIGGVSPVYIHGTFHIPFEFAQWTAQHAIMCWDTFGGGNNNGETTKPLYATGENPRTCVVTSYDLTRKINIIYKNTNEELKKIEYTSNVEYKDGTEIKQGDKKITKGLCFGQSCDNVLTAATAQPTDNSRILDVYMKNIEAENTGLLDFLYGYHYYWYNIRNKEDTYEGTVQPLYESPDRYNPCKMAVYDANAKEDYTKEINPLICLYYDLKKNQQTYGDLFKDKVIPIKCTQSENSVTCTCKDATQCDEVIAYDNTYSTVKDFKKARGIMIKLKDKYIAVTEIEPPKTLKPILYLKLPPASGFFTNEIRNIKTTNEFIIDLYYGARFPGQKNWGGAIYRDSAEFDSETIKQKKFKNSPCGIIPWNLDYENLGQLRLFKEGSVLWQDDADLVCHTTWTGYDNICDPSCAPLGFTKGNLRLGYWDYTTVYEESLLGILGYPTWADCDGDPLKEVLPTVGVRTGQPENVIGAELPRQDMLTFCLEDEIMYWDYEPGDGVDDTGWHEKMPKGTGECYGGVGFLPACSRG